MPLPSLQRKVNYLWSDVFPSPHQLLSFFICFKALFKRSLCDSELEIKFK